MKMPPRLAEAIARTLPLDELRLREARNHLDTLTKPLGSLGRLEDLAAQLYAIRPRRHSIPLRKAVYVFAADHGVACEGVSLYPQEVTAQMVQNFLNGGAAINVLARQHQADLLVIDAGVNGDLDEAVGLHRSKIAYGTQNFAQAPAMTEEHTAQALLLGLDLAGAADEKGYDLIAVGEMGIGNTSSASAITAVLTSTPLEQVTGLGTGLDEQGRQHKIRILQRALALHCADRTTTPLDVLRCLGGLEIAAMVGFVLGLSSYGRAVICDGFISSAAAALAYALCPNVRQFLFAGHQSEERGHRYLLRFMGLQPILSLDLRLGEGTGAVLAMSILESALRLYQEMATFQSAGVSRAAL